MKTPRYTDAHRFPPTGYTRSEATDIKQTFDRAQARITAEKAREAANAVEAQRKTVNLKARSGK